MGSESSFKQQYEEAFGPIASSTVAADVVTSINREFDALFPEEDPNNVPLKIQHSRVNARGANDGMHSQGVVLCEDCGVVIANYCTHCVGPHALVGLTRQLAALAEGHCDDCRWVASPLL